MKHKNWCKGKHNDEIENELIRQLLTYDKQTLVSLMVGECILTRKDKCKWINEFNGY